MMIQFLINLYNDLKIWYPENQGEDEKVSNCYEFMDEVRTHIESENKNNAFYHDYFLLIETIFNCDIYKAKEFFEYCGMDQRPTRLKFCSVLALTWKCDYNKNYMDEFHYLLDNLHFDTVRNNRHENTRDHGVFVRVMQAVLDMAEKIANSGNSVLEFVSKTPGYDMINEIPSVRPLDWTEEHIKAKILAGEHLLIDYFDGIENDFNRRIRIFLFISGYWEGNGTRTDLEKYIGLVKRFGITGNTEPHIVFKKLFYILATGYSNIPPISGDPAVDVSLYFWEDNDKRQTEKIHLFRQALDFLHTRNFKTYDELSGEIKTIAEGLYHDNDWRSLVLSRDYEKLFSSWYSSDYSDKKPLSFIPIAVMMEDIHAKSGDLVYSQKQDRGTVGQNTQVGKRITNSSQITINIHLDCQNKEKYIFYTKKDTCFSVYEYSGFDNGKHNFSIKTFDISKDVKVLNGTAEAIKKIIGELDNKTKTAFMYNDDDGEVRKKTGKSIDSDNCKFDIGHYYYDIISYISKEITVNIDDVNQYQPAKETLELDKDG
jgi:hypothetical protein